MVGLPPAPSPRVSVSPRRRRAGVRACSSACASVFIATNSTPLTPTWIMWLMAFVPAPPTPTARMRAALPFAGCAAGGGAPRRSSAGCRCVFSVLSRLPALFWLSWVIVRPASLCVLADITIGIASRACRLNTGGVRSDFLRSPLLILLSCMVLIFARKARPLRLRVWHGVASGVHAVDALDALDSLADWRTRGAASVVSRAVILRLCCAAARGPVLPPWRRPADGHPTAGQRYPHAARVALEYPAPASAVSPIPVGRRSHP